MRGALARLEAVAVDPAEFIDPVIVSLLAGRRVEAGIDQPFLDVHALQRLSKNGLGLLPDLVFGRRACRLAPIYDPAGGAGTEAQDRVIGRPLLHVDLREDARDL